MREKLPDGRALVLAERSDTALAILRLAFIKRTLHLFLQRPPSGAERLSDLARSAITQDPKEALACFAAPTVAAPIHCFDTRASQPRFAGRIDKAFSESAAHLLLELASRELLPADEKADWTSCAPTLVSPRLGIAIQPPKGARGWRFQRGLLTALTPEGDGPSLRLGAASLARGRLPVRGLRTELAYVSVTDGIRLALVDNNPIAELEAHPDKAGNALDLGGRSEDDWREALQTAFAWIRERMPVLFAEMELVLSQVVPVGYQAQKHLSASYREDVGTIYLTLHPNPLTMAEALIHEFQHNKANIASYSDGLLLNAFHPLFKSPVRPDPRPLWGVLLAVHAFLPVAVFYRSLRDAGHPVSKTPDFERRLDDIDLKNHEGMEVLRSHADPTPFGRQLMFALDELDRRHMAERSARGLSVKPVAAHV